jgi:hypothetical protein
MSRGYSNRFPRTGALANRPIYPGDGYPPNPGEDREGLSPFGRLAKGQPLGKSSILIYNGSGADRQPSAVDMLVVEGDDLDAQQLIVTLAPPRVVPQAFAALRIDQQNLSGEQTNAEITAGNFPGTLAPIAWPPLEAFVEWGVRGAQAQAIVDYVNGVTFSVAASYLRVSAVVTQSENSGGIGGTSAAYYLAAFVGPGFARGNAQRTVFVGTLDTDSESGVYEVPRFAKRAYVLGHDNTTPPTLADGYLRFWQAPTGVGSGTNVGNAFFSANQPVGFDVPAAAAYFSVYNQSGATMRMSVVFELALS